MKLVYWVVLCTAATPTALWNRVENQHHCYVSGMLEWGLEFQGCRPWGCRGCHGTPILWQRSQIFLNQGGGQLIPTKQYWPPPPLIFRPSYDPDRIICFSVVWSFIALKWLLSTLYFQEDDYKNWDPHLELTKAVLASICLDVLLAGSELFHKVRLEMRKRRQTTEAAQEVEMLNHPPPPQSRA